MVKKAIRIIAIAEISILASYFISFSFFINLQVAFLSSLFVVLGSSFAYNQMVNRDLASGNFEDKRDFLDEVEDPHGLYDEEPINETPAEELDLKEIVKEEKAKIKTFSKDSLKKGAKGSFSAFRIAPYIFLILGFIALKNNELLNIAIYLPSLLSGIIIGSITSKEFFKG